MGRLDQLRASLGAHAAESLGQRETAPTPTPAPAEVPPVTPPPGRSRAREAAWVELGLIEPDPDQPRKTFAEEDLDALAATLRSHGQLQPVRVWWSAERGRWILLVGERRFRAAQRAGLERLLCVCLEAPPDPGERLLSQMVENLCRSDLPPLEAARGYQELMRQRDCGVREVADLVGVSAATVSRSLALLKLPDGQQQKLERGETTASASYRSQRQPRLRAATSAGPSPPKPAPARQLSLSVAGVSVTFGFRWPPASLESAALDLLPELERQLRQALASRAA